MRRTLQLATAALMLIANAQLSAQFPLRTDKPQVEDLSWMWQYTQPLPSGNASALLADARLKLLLTEHLKAPQSFWNKGKSLTETIVEHFGQGRAVIAA